VVSLSSATIEIRDEMKLIIAIIKPFKLEEVKSAFKDSS